jgi:hypothetical protein
MSYEEGERDFVVNASLCTLTALINATPLVPSTQI